MPESASLPKRLVVIVYDSQVNGMEFEAILDTEDDGNTISQVAIEGLGIRSIVSSDSNHVGSLGEVNLLFELKGAENGTLSYRKMFRVEQQSRPDVTLGKSFQRDYDGYVQSGRLAPFQMVKMTKEEEQALKEEERKRQAQQAETEDKERQERQRAREEQRRRERDQSGNNDRG